MHCEPTTHVVMSGNSLPQYFTMALEKEMVKKLGGRETAVGPDTN